MEQDILKNNITCCLLIQRQYICFPFWIGKLLKNNSIKVFSDLWYISANYVAINHGYRI
jgi:hypothetical protein